jgi:flagellar biogenesis protein FliO
MKSQTNTESYQVKPHHTNNNPGEYFFLSQDHVVLFLYAFFALGWVMNRLISSRYKGSFYFKNKSGMKISANLTPPEKND